MISLFHNDRMKIGVVMDDGMPMLVITDEAVLDFEAYVEDALSKNRQTSKSSVQRTLLDAFLRCPDEKLGWKKL